MADTEAEPEPTPEPTPEPEPVTGDDSEKWKALSRKNEKALKDAQRELEKLREASMSETEKAVAQAKAEGRAEAFQDMNQRLLHAEARAAAAGVLVDPELAVHLLDLSQFEANGDIDGKGLKRAVEQLAKDRPYLAVQPGNGAGEGGARGVPHSPALNGDPLEADLRRKLGIT